MVKEASFQEIWKILKTNKSNRHFKQFKLETTSNIPPFQVDRTIFSTQRGFQILKRGEK